MHISHARCAAYQRQVREANGKFSPALHCFPVYGGGLEVHGVDGIMQVRNCSLSAPIRP
jgi:hypothetical protein